MPIKILPTITTTKKWREKIQEAKELKLKEVCFFPTVLEKADRKEAYKLLQKAGIKKIPFVHLKDDMDLKEIEFLMEKFHTKVFNIHTQNEYPFSKKLLKFKKQIFLETTITKFAEGEAKEWGGMCLDSAHMENLRKTKSPLYKIYIKLLQAHKIGCAHISAIAKNPVYDPGRKGEGYDVHTYTNLKEFDYLKRYKEFFPSIMALELENTLAEQIKAKNYIKENIL